MQQHLQKQAAGGGTEGLGSALPWAWLSAAAGARGQQTLVKEESRTPSFPLSQVYALSPDLKNPLVSGLSFCHQRSLAV